MEIVTDAAGSGAGRRLSVLEQVLLTHGEVCRCDGACGTEHDSWKCRRADGTPKTPLLAAPRPLPRTEHETVAAPAETLRPWCTSCWSRARRRNVELAAELRRQQLAEAQLAFDDEALFGGGQ